MFDMSMATVTVSTGRFPSDTTEYASKKWPLCEIEDIDAIKSRALQRGMSGRARWWGSGIKGEKRQKGSGEARKGIRRDLHHVSVASGNFHREDVLQLEPRPCRTRHIASLVHGIR